MPSWRRLRAAAALAALALVLLVQAAANGSIDGRICPTSVCPPVLARAAADDGGRCCPADAAQAIAGHADPSCDCAHLPAPQADAAIPAPPALGGAILPPLLPATEPLPAPARTARPIAARGHDPPAATWPARCLRSIVLTC